MQEVMKRIVALLNLCHSKNNIHEWKEISHEGISAICMCLKEQYLVVVPDGRNVI